MKHFFKNIVESLKANYTAGLGEPPGLNFRTGYIDPQKLCASLLIIIDYLENLEPGVDIYQTKDWIEHEGTSFGGWKSLSFDRLKNMVSSPEILLMNMPHDDLVNIGIAPLANSWYLRIYLEEDDDEEEGKFDITMKEEYVDTFRDNVLPCLDINIFEEDSNSYYESLK
ncbi:MAG: hypothetical protein GY754_22080 [bacterium]|nr:hypothetical protein [bacterium]